MHLHREVFADAFPDQAGRQRTEPVTVGGEQRCPPGLIGQRLADFGTQLNERLSAVEGDPYAGEERFKTQVELATWRTSNISVSTPSLTETDGRPACC